MKTLLKDPGGISNFGFDYSDWLATGDTISTSVWEVPSGVTNDADSKTTTTTTITLSGGTVGIKYRLTNSIVTANGEETDRSFYVKVENL